MKLALEGTIDEKETIMELSGVCSPVDDSCSFGEVLGARESHEQTGLDGWPGRFWLPAQSQAQPAGNSCLSHAFGLPGEPPLTLHMQKVRRP
jgi:hypothetical protein